MEPTTGLSWVDLLAAFAPLVGAGGLSGVAIAYFSYLRSARAGRRAEPEKAELGISAILADSSSVKDLTNELAQLRTTFEHGSTNMDRLVNDLIDEVRKLRRTFEDMTGSGSD